MASQKNKPSVGLTQKIFWIFMSLLVFLISSAGVLFYQYFRQISENSVRESLQLVIRNNAASVNDFFGRLETLGHLINEDLPTFAPLLNEHYDDAYGQYTAYKHIYNQIIGYLQVTAGELTTYKGYLLVDGESTVSPILVQATEDTFRSIQDFSGYAAILRDDQLQQEDWFQRAQELAGEPYWFQFSPDDGRIWMVQQLETTVYESGRVQTYSLGMLLLGLDISWIKEQINVGGLTRNTQVFLVDGASRVIYSADPAYQGQELAGLLASLPVADPSQETDTQEDLDTLFFDGREHLALAEPLTQGLTLLTLVPTYDIDEQAGEIFRIVLLVLVGVLLAGMMLIAASSRMIVRPIKRLSSHMMTAGSPEPISCQGIAHDEVGSLYHSFNDLVDRVNTLIREVHEFSQRQKEQELKLLQAQINPHFLYNTLDSVCCIALLHGETEIADALSALASLLRYNIKEPDKLVPLEQELEMVENYVSIQRLRCGKRLEYFCELEPGAENLLIPKMMIQPLVENCIAHGAANENGDISITVTVLCEEAGEGPEVTIVVHDEGSGDVDAINAHLSGARDLSRDTGGLGIRNVQQRIQLAFGKGYGLTYRREDGGTSAVITIPRLKGYRSPDLSSFSGTDSGTDPLPENDTEGTEA